MTETSYIANTEAHALKSPAIHPCPPALTTKDEDELGHLLIAWIPSKGTVDSIMVPL